MDHYIKLLFKKCMMAICFFSICAITKVNVVMDLFFLTCRKRQIETNMMKMIWKINIDDIELQKSRAGVGSRVLK